MQKYTLHELKDKDQTIYCVFEEETQQVIDAFILREDAVQLYNTLMNGGGFNGHTPAFFLTEINIKETNLDYSFEKEFH